MGQNWTKEETIIAFNLYCKIPFKDCSGRHPLVRQYAEIIGRTPDAVNMKVGNIGRFDPELKKQGITGLSHGARLEKEVWAEFYADPERFTFESELLLARYAHRSIEETIPQDNLPEGREREVVVRQRVNQAFFRTAVVEAYDATCCISGIRCPELVEACHIVDWSLDVKNRTNPMNGLCLNPLFHKSYDRNLVAVTPDYEIVVSDQLIESATEDDFRRYLMELRGRKIIAPKRFLPSRELLEVHYSRFNR